MRIKQYTKTEIYESTQIQTNILTIVTVRYVMEIPEVYNHKATSESFNGTDKVSIYYSDTVGDYQVYVFANQEENGKTLYLSKSQLELLVHAGTDVLDNLSHG